MEIKRLDIRYLHKDMSAHIDMDGNHHIKSLPWLSVVQSVEGSYTVSTDGGTPVETGSGGFFIAPSQVTQSILHHSDPHSHLMQNRWLFIEAFVNDTYPLDHLYDFPLLLPKEAVPAMHTLFEQLFAAHDLCDEMSVCYQIIKQLLAIGHPHNRLENAALLRVTDYMRTHFAEVLDIPRLARVAGLSPSGLFTAFGQQFGMSPIAYLNHYRLTLASALLKETALPIHVIAERVGFSDPLYFSRQFHRLFSLPPREYRKIP